MPAEAVTSAETSAEIEPADEGDAEEDPPDAATTDDVSADILSADGSSADPIRAAAGSARTDPQGENATAGALDNPTRRAPRASDAVPLYHRNSCDRPLAWVSRAFASQLQMQGTGKLRDGRTLNVSGPCDCSLRSCFFVVQAEKTWGMGVGKRPLAPFRSVAVDTAVVPIGKLLYVPELDGLTMPGQAPWGGFVHDGCVVADDRGGNIDGKQVDFFVGRRSAYNGFAKRHRLQRVTVYDGAGRCQKRNGKITRVHRNST
jgi:3D (Asp-Asp-Asp) domain-containing protein